MVILWDVSSNSIQIDFEKVEHHSAENYEQMESAVWTTARARSSRNDSSTAPGLRTSPSQSACGQGHGDTLALLMEGKHCDSGQDTEAMTQLCDMLGGKG